jgi:hypothetical protein
MIIISELPEYKVLVTMTKDELANILGQSSKYSIEKDFIYEAIKNQTNLNASDIYNKHVLIKDIQNLSSYNTARKRLEEMLKALTPIEDQVKLLANTNKQSS